MTRSAVLLALLLLVAADVRTARADARLEQIMIGWLSRDAAALRTEIDEALAVYRNARDPRREAIAYLFLSLLDAKAGNPQASSMYLGEAATRFEASRDYAGAWLANWLLAEHEHLRERESDHVLALYEKALAMLEKAESPSAPFSLDALMVVGPIAGLPPAEYEPHGAPAAVHKRFVLLLLEVFTRTGYGAELLRVGALDKAERELRRAKEIGTLFDGRLDPPIDRHIGTLRRRQERLHEARESYERALAGLQVPRAIGTITPPRLKVELFGELAELEMLGGRIEEALAWNDRALELVRAARSAETEAEVLKERAELLVRAGRFGAAETALAQALALAETNDYFDVQVSVHLASAKLHATRGRHGAAAADMERAVEAVARANDPAREPLIWAHLAMMYVLLDADDSARIALERARELAERNGRCLDVAFIELIESTTSSSASVADFNKALEEWSRAPDAGSVPIVEHPPQVMVTITGSPTADPQKPVRSGALTAGMPELLQAGALFSQQRQLPEARALAMKALELNPNAKHRAGALMLIGGTWLAEGREREAIAWLRKALDALDAAAEDASADPLLSASGDGGWASTASDLLIQLLVKHRRQDEAFAVSERARARVFLQLLGNNRVSPRGSENTLPAQEAETLRTQMLQWQQQPHLAPTGELRDDLREARGRYEALMTRVRASNPEYAQMTTVEPLPVDAIRGELPPNTTLLSYFVTENGAYAWLLDAAALEYVSLPFGRTALERVECAATQFHVVGRGVRPLNAPCEPATAEELYGRLFAPLRAHIRNPRLIVVPHGVLHYLPFGAFRDPGTKRYLIEDYTITYAPSASSIGFLRDKETPVNGKALVIGAPAGVLPDLPGALQEATAVGADLQAVPLVGAAAKESLLYQLQGEVDLVHIAAHGFYEPDTPLFSRLALAEGDGEDGNLEVHEILSDVDLTGVNLVVLSACQTALGKGNAGDDVVGLTRALLYAGTPGVLSTLWDIGDYAAAELMDHFYCRLLQGDSAADALRDAQLQLLHGDYPEPRHWAAFTLHGNPEGRW